MRVAADTKGAGGGMGSDGVALHLSAVMHLLGLTELYTKKH